MNGNREGAGIAGSAACKAQRSRRNRAPAHRATSGLAVLAAAAALGLAACSGPSSPHVANLAATGSDGGGSRAATPAAGPPSPEPSPTLTPLTGNPTQLLDEWATCMQDNGDPGQAEPTVDANKVIHVTISPSVQGGIYGYSGEDGSGGPGLACTSYLEAAQTALRGGQSLPPPDQGKLERLSQCMRANGVPDFPDPTNETLSINVGAGGDLNPNNPTFKNAAKLCSGKVGVQMPGVGTPPPGTVVLNGAGGLAGG